MKRRLKRPRRAAKTAKKRLKTLSISETCVFVKLGVFAARQTNSRRSSVHNLRFCQKPPTHALPLAFA
jgi:hypothetical protein